ncbi:HAD family hydrolase [Alkalinema sp. FACHB-956]|uniref:HAD family hydrolase n=1 Tax=Alkalinema sp. FACHB-956 TaxID=2692768 RepID=UPI001688AD74|nr:HAD family hydrolase [Alkalinema sp. FACHB-956]MBD2325906.1 HAD family phosphatase [Alkalinema sp. FACHB-956]
MFLRPIAQAQGEFSAIQCVATDMDGTLTQQGKFSPALLQAFERLADRAIPVVIVTGRSAGWVSAISHYLPIAGAIAENGGLFYQGDRSEWLVPISDLQKHRQALSETFAALQSHFPQLQESSDNRFRLTDWTFDVQGLSRQQLQALSQCCEAQGWTMVYSTVQCHIKLPKQSKLQGLQQVLRLAFPTIDPQQVVTVGDSPNDESLFQMPLSVGVANVQHYVDQLSQLPQFVTQAEEGAGFCELVELMMSGEAQSAK